MVDIKLWLPSGTKVKILNPYFQNRIGTIREYLYITQNYVVAMENGSTLMFKPSEVAEIV